jgi:ABC-type polysaccharide/polyol phosphate transport system ATPase subunit
MDEKKISALLENHDVILKNVSVEYNIPSEQIKSIKSFAIKKLKGEIKINTFLALNNISLNIRKGEIFGVIGQNGAGKSTLMKVISRVLIPNKGRVITNGRVYPLLQLGAGFHPELTGLENIFLNGTLLGHTQKEIGERVDDIIDFAEIGEFIYAPVRNYSSGMRARLGFSVATAWQPDILVLDEVLSVGDIGFKEKCENRMRTFRENGTTTILVSHSPQTIAEICSRAMWLHRGRIRKIGEAAVIAEDYRNLQKGKFN